MLKGECKAEFFKFYLSNELFGSFAKECFGVTIKHQSNHPHGSMIYRQTDAAVEVDEVIIMFPFLLSMISFTM